ncbi:hypothetical protein AAG570_000012 [Ranatra chinensis]|uniref:Integrase catalytic domain-containing protein n=1 Tax=Ranatra chinensis TaxID=642074 RepID=A0ABD0YW40_9HEMI
MITIKKECLGVYYEAHKIYTLSPKLPRPFITFISLYRPSGLTTIYYNGARYSISRSHGTVERLHSTFQEHLHLLRIGRGVRGEEAWARTLLAYNSSLHSATWMTPLSVNVRGWWKRSIGRKGIVSTVDPIIGRNDKATDQWDRGRAGDLVSVRNWYKRRKTDPRFVGPFVVVRTMSRYRLQLRNPATGRLRIVLANGTRPPAAQRRRGE